MGDDDNAVTCPPGSAAVGTVAEERSRSAQAMAIAMAVAPMSSTPKGTRISSPPSTRNGLLIVRLRKILSRGGTGPQKLNSYLSSRSDLRTRSRVFRATAW